MKHILRMLFTIILLLLTSFCTKSEKEDSFRFKNIKSKELFSRTLPEYFEVVDSCILEYPIELYPKGIGDISITENLIYVFGGSENMVYPIVVFTRGGKYIKTISRIGNGPGEIPFDLTRISAYKQKLAVASTGRNRITIFENGEYIRERRFELEKDSIQIKDVLFYNDDNIFIFCNSFAKYNLIVLNDKLEIGQKLFMLPASTSLTSIIGYTIWGMQKNGNKVVTHPGYPDIIVEVEQNNGSFQIINQLDRVNFTRYQRLPSNITATTFKKEGLDAKDLFTSFSQIKWIILSNNYLVGLHSFWSDNTQKNVMTNVSKNHNYLLFIAENDGNIIIEKPLTEITGKRVIPDNENLVEYFFYQDSDNIFLQLNILQLKLQQ